jgi:nuclear pore complex protein Nup205
MAELHENLASLRGLYQDLSAIPDSAFLNVERLVIELETHIQDFQKLLDKPAKSNASRQTVLSGKWSPIISQLCFANPEDMSLNFVATT